MSEAIVKREEFREAREIVVGTLIQTTMLPLTQTTAHYVFSFETDGFPKRRINVQRSFTLFELQQMPELYELGTSYELACHGDEWEIRGPATFWGSR